MSGGSQSCAVVFAALGDVTRLALLERLASGEARSIKHLSEGLDLTRQGVTKHLDVLEDAQLVMREKVGRESLYQVRPGSVHRAQDYLARASAQWDAAVDRLKALVEG